MKSGLLLRGSLMVEEARTLEAAGVEVWREMEREQTLFAETITCLHREVEAGWYLERILDASCAQMSALPSPVEDGMLLLEGCLRQVNSAQHLQQQEFRGRLRSTANLCHNLAFELQVLRADVRAHEEVAARKGEFEREAGGFHCTGDRRARRWRPNRPPLNCRGFGRRWSACGRRRG